MICGANRCLFPTHFMSCVLNGATVGCVMVKVSSGIYVTGYIIS